MKKDITKQKPHKNVLLLNTVVMLFLYLLWSFLNLPLKILLQMFNTHTLCACILFFLLVFCIDRFA